MALYNKAPYVRDALASVAAQSSPPLEIIVVDDGSTDDGVAIVNAMSLPTLRLVRQTNGGPGPARNAGLSLAKGEFIAFIDADDLWAPDHLETLGDLVASFPGALLFANDFAEFSGKLPHLNLVSDEMRSARSFDYFAEQLSRSRVWTSCTAVNRKAALQLGGFGDFCPGEDCWLWQSLALSGDTAVTDKVTSFYRRGINGLMDAHQTDSTPSRSVDPTIAQLEDYLSKNPQSSKYEAVRAYNRAQWQNALRQSLYCQKTETIKWTLEQMNQRHIPIPPLLAFLASLPPSLLRLGIALHHLRRRIRDMFQPLRSASAGSEAAS